MSRAVFGNLVKEFKLKKERFKVRKFGPKPNMRYLKALKMDSPTSEIPKYENLIIF